MAKVPVASWTFEEVVPMGRQPQSVWPGRTSRVNQANAVERVDNSFGRPWFFSTISRHPSRRESRQGCEVLSVERMDPYAWLLMIT